ncbi:MAG TPA: hypothetical protein VFA21_19365 [Pyrinomonadaceae bacterium]|nr:hypothetical protein [Pyrinomonadaceae bacterium]
MGEKRSHPPGQRAWSVGRRATEVKTAEPQPGERRGGRRAWLVLLVVALFALLLTLVCGYYVFSPGGALGG